MQNDQIGDTLLSYLSLRGVSGWVDGAGPQLSRVRSQILLDFKMRT
jgi:hypothetical protein